jgi:hypothetical protein
MRFHSVVLWAPLAAVLPLAGGCFTAAKEGIGVATGPKGVYAQTQRLAPGDTSTVLAPYGRFELEGFQDDFAGQAPPALLEYLPLHFRRQLAQHKLLPNDEGKTLLVRGTVIYYQSVGTVGGVVLGDIEQVVTRVELVDQGSQQVLGQAICVGLSTDRVNMGVEKKAEGLAKAIVQWIADNCPVPSKQ